MYGTIFHMKVKPGQTQQAVDLFQEWERDRQPNVKGAIGGLVMRPENRSDELVGVAIFQDKAAYTANADDPEQHKCFLKLRDLLEADPTWEDGEYVAGQIG